MKFVPSLLCLLLAGCSPWTWHVADSASVLYATQHAVELNPLGLATIPAKVGAEVVANHVPPETATALRTSARSASLFGATFSASTLLAGLHPGAALVIGIGALSGQYQDIRIQAIRDSYPETCYQGPHDIELMQQAGVQAWERPLSDSFVCVWGGDGQRLVAGGWRAL